MSVQACAKTTNDEIDSGPSQSRRHIERCVSEADGAQEAIATLSKAPGADGFVIIAGDESGELYRYQHGALFADTRINIASASKWATAVTMMTLAERDEIDLDASIDAYFPGLEPAKAQITIRQLLTHTSGIDGALVQRDNARGGMQAIARRLLEPDLIAAPGASFHYGGSSMQVAGGIAEKATGKNWSALFSERVAEPLGLASAAWGRPLKGPEVGKEVVGSGLFISAQDYARFTLMLSRDGENILNQSSVQEMFSEQVGNPVGKGAPATVKPGSSYAIGGWCEAYAAPGGDCGFVHSAGAWGTYPWIDRTDGTWGVIFIYTRLPKIVAAERVLIKAVEGCM